MTTSPDPSNKLGKRIVFVLGIPRSGIGLLARGMRALGVSEAPSGSRHQDADEDSGPAAIAALNDQLLAAMVKRWDSLALPTGEDLAGLWEPYHARALELVAQCRSDAATFGLIQDPRVTLLLPFWQQVCERAGLTASYVIALRNPASVVLSLAAKDGLSPEKSYPLWLQYMFAAVSDSHGKASVVVDFDALIGGPAEQLTRIAHRLDLPVTEQAKSALVEYANGIRSLPVRHAGHATAATSDDPRAGALVGKAHALLGKLAMDGLATPEQKAAFEYEWQAFDQALRGAEPLFRYLEACESKVDILLLNQRAPAAPPEQARESDEPWPVPRVADADKTETRPRVSVVIPLYNHEEYIEEAIDSVLAQTVPAFEIIVVDDGSTDGSVAKMREILVDHPEIIFWSWPNQGAHHTLNAAIYRATGDYVAILNSDDCFEPDRLDACLAQVAADPTVDVVVTELSFIDNHGRRLSNPWYDAALAFHKAHDDLALALFNGNFLVTTSNLFIRRSLFDALGPIAPLRYAHDLELFFRLILAGKHLHFLARPLLRYRSHGRNTIAEDTSRVDVELALIFAYFIHRRLALAAADGRHDFPIDRYLEALKQKKLLELVEYFLSCFAGGTNASETSIPGPYASELMDLLRRIAPNWGARAAGNTLLAEFVTARNDFLRHQIDAIWVGNALAELKTANAWLAGQRNAWQETASERERQAQSLKRALDEQLAGNVWLGEQRDAWKAAADTAQGELAEWAAKLAHLQSELAGRQSELAKCQSELAAQSAKLVAYHTELAASRAGLRGLLGSRIFRLLVRMNIFDITPFPPETPEG